MQKKQDPEPIFINIKEDPEPIVTQSLCMNCQDNGQTTILLTKIPFFREIIISSFFCSKCNFKNNEVQFAGELPSHGVQILFKIINKEDLNREIIKSEFATLKFHELELQIPESKKAEINTIQGILARVQEELSQNQEIRRTEDKQSYEKIEKFIRDIDDFKEGKNLPLTLKISDPSGNSNIKNPFAPKLDKNLHITNTQRSLETLVRMGYSVENAKESMKKVDDSKIGNKINFTKPFEENNFMNTEPTIFQLNCHACTMPGEMKMCQTSIPYFTDLTIMSFKCDYCGAHSTQTKNSGEIRQACTITLKVSSEQDLKRDLFKSQTCSVKIPEIELQLDYGTLGGVYTTVEGLVEKILDHLHQTNPFSDSDNEFYGRMMALFEDLKLMMNGSIPFTMILRDPVGHSFLQNPYHPDVDPTAAREVGARTEEEDEILGISDMQVENYK